MVSVRKMVNGKWQYTELVYKNAIVKQARHGVSAKLSPSDAKLVRDTTLIALKRSVVGKKGLKGRILQRKANERVEKMDKRKLRKNLIKNLIKG